MSILTNGKNVYKTSEVARMLRVSEGTVKNLCKSGTIPGVFRVGRSWRIPADGLRRYIDSTKPKK